MAVHPVCPSFKLTARRAAKVSFLFGMLLLGSCSTTADMTSLEVPLVFRPEMVCSGQYDTIPASPGLKLFVAPIVDERSDKDRIGQNTELVNKEPRPILAAGQRPQDFLHDVFVKEFTCIGIAPVADAAGANRTLSIRLLRFFTNESSTYNCQIRVAAEVRDQAGAVLWQGRTTGASSRFGRSMSPTNYQESFSDASLGVVANLLDDPGFQAALTTK